MIVQCTVCSSEHQLRKVRMILDLGRTVGLLLLDPTTLLTLPPQRGDPLSQSSPFLLVFHLTRTRLNWPLLITVRATFKCLPDPLHYVLKIHQFHPLQNQQKIILCSFLSKVVVGTCCLWVVRSWSFGLADKFFHLPLLVHQVVRWQKQGEVCKLHL